MKENAETFAPKTIFIDIPCPVSMRNTITGPKSVYQRLVAMGHNVIILTPEYAADCICESFGATVEPVIIERSNTRFEQVSDFITKHLNLTRMQILGSKYGLRHNLDSRTRKAYLHFLRVIIAHTLGKSNWFRLRAAPQLHLYAYNRRPLRAVFEKYKPDLVFLPNPGSYHSEETLRECKRQKIKTIGMVGSWDHPHKKFHVLHTDTVFVWSPALKKELIELQSYSPEQVIVSGAPHFDLYKQSNLILSREDFFAEMKLDSKKHLVTLFSGTGRAPDEGDIVDMILKWSESGQIVAPIVMHIRSYPSDPEEHKKYDQFEGRPGLFIDWIDYGKGFGPFPINYFPDEKYMTRVINLFFHSDIILSVYSSASVEAGVFLKPPINIAFDGYKKRPFKESVKRFVYQSHFDKLFETGAVLDTHTPEELLKAINQVLTDPSVNRDNIIKLQKFVCGPLDGKTSERMAAHINECLQSNR